MKLGVGMAHAGKAAVRFRSWQLTAFFFVVGTGCGVDEDKVEYAYLAGYQAGITLVPTANLLLAAGVDVADLGAGPQTSAWEDISCAARYEVLVGACDSSDIDFAETIRSDAYEYGLADGCQTGDAGDEFECEPEYRDRQAERGAGYNWWTSAHHPETCEEAVLLYMHRDMPGERDCTEVLSEVHIRPSRTW